MLFPFFLPIAFIFPTDTYFTYVLFYLLIFFPCPPIPQIAMDSSMNGHLPQERSGDEEVPLILLSSDLDRRQRAKALSQLSHQSQGSNVYDIGHDEVSVTMTTTSKQKMYFSFLLSCARTKMGNKINNLKS